VKILLELGADVNKSGSEGICALHRAVDNGNLEITQMLVKAKNCDINTADKSYGWTALHVAAMHNDMEIAKTLIYRGAALNARDLSWQTPLTFAQQNKSYQVAHFLRSHGAIESYSNKPKKLMKHSYNFNIREY
jgi:ankyrin repeat protein